MRKSIRGEPLTDAERKLLADRSEAARAAGKFREGVPHHQVMAELEERREREQSSPRRK